MLKRILCLLLILLVSVPALAEPRYPAQSGVATDAAAVLSAKVLSDLRTLDKRLSRADAPRIYVVTVDFLDGSDVQSYADALFSRWELPDNAVLLLLAVGEESYAICVGRNVDRLVPRATLEKLLAAHLHDPFLGQRYDAALAGFVHAYAGEASKACGTSIKTDDLFRSVSATLFDNWAGAQSADGSDAGSGSLLTRTDKGSGFSLLTVVLIVVLLMLIFGSFRKIRHISHPEAAAPAPQKPAKDARPVYFKPREKKPTPQYFHPRKPAK